MRGMRFNETRPGRDVAVAAESGPATVAGQDSPLIVTNLVSASNKSYRAI